MPISYLPVLITLALIIALVIAGFKSKRAFVRVLIIEVLFVGGVYLLVYIPGWILLIKANRNDEAAQYELSRWYENHYEYTSSLFLLPPTGPDFESSFPWLIKSAESNYPPALYALGVRYKYGEFVPRPEDWSGPEGNVFPQPEKGQPLIEKALSLRYNPPVEERLFYWREFRK